MLIPNSEGSESEPRVSEIREAWSLAARAAATAARKGRGKGLTSRKRLGTAAYRKAGGDSSPSFLPKIQARLKKIGAELARPVRAKTPAAKARKLLLNKLHQKYSARLLHIQFGKKDTRKGTWQHPSGRGK